MKRERPISSRLVTWLSIVCTVAFYVPAATSGGENDITSAGVRRSIEAGLRIVQKAATNYPEHRQCFSCHHQTLPLQAMATARKIGVAIDEELLRSQAQFTLDSFGERAEGMREGRGVGGQSMTVAFGLWALDLAKVAPNETTEAMVTYLLKKQSEDGHWQCTSSRPPLEQSHVSCTVLSAHYMQKFAAEGQREEVASAVAQAAAWLPTVQPTSHEDALSVLGGLALLRGEKRHLAAARDTVLAAQHEDGGWSQITGMASDAYSTGQTLYVLRQLRVPATDPAIGRGMKFLLDTQHDDGSWRVETRSKPIQVYFDNGDPHGKNQFISIPATSWAVAALAAIQGGP